MLESKFSFIGKIFLILFCIINLPALFPVKLFNVSYLILVTTTILDTSSLLILSLSISKYIHKKNLYRIQKSNSQDNRNNKSIDQINSSKIKVNNDNKLSFILAVIFAIFTLIQPIILILDIQKNDLYSGSMINSINMQYNNQINDIEELILKEKSQNNDKKELNKLSARINTLTLLKDKNIERIAKNSNTNKFANVKTIIRNFLLGVMFSLCFYKIYKI